MLLLHLNTNWVVHVSLCCWLHWQKQHPGRSQPPKDGVRVPGTTTGTELCVCRNLLCACHRGQLQSVRASSLALPRGLVPEPKLCVEVSLTLYIGNLANQRMASETHLRARKMGVKYIYTIIAGFLSCALSSPSYRTCLAWVTLPRV